MDNVKDILEQNQKTIKEKFLSKPNSSWANTENYFSLQIDDIVPISNLELEFKKEIPEWIAIDLNNNKIADKNELIKFEFENSKIKIIMLFANRTRFRF